MADVDAYLPLAAEFPPVSVDDWLTLVGNITRLRTATYDGITIEPLYTAADEVPAAGLPGQFPFVRGRTARGARQGWDVRQLVDVRWGQRAAIAELERGATSVWLRWRADDPVDPASLAGVLDDVLFDVAPVVLDGGHRWVDAARAMRPLWERAAVDPALLAGSLGADPFGDWAVRRDDDRLAADLTALVAEAGPLVAEYPNLRIATIDATRFHDAGASDAEELGIGLAGVVATWRTLTEGGLDVAAAMARLELRLATTVDQFASIAKFRAARQVLARVAEVAGHPTAGSLVPLHAVTSRAMTTRYDAAVNIVRSTVACFAAAVGGADAITVLPHDTFVAAPPSERARRLARNTQAVLALESNVTSVIDAAGGSWYVERLTEHLAERAWDVFQKIESADGFRRAVESGLVDGLVAATRA
ncbi:MAG TPA: methylmalonyl-CoA mutase family protein, partial [Desertimonas sp.]|nr:methylmalonyl-CoA mutase family protein [Desertimonas sp.]